jgi:uncharacterized protein (DUF302 family)
MFIKRFEMINYGFLKVKDIDLENVKNAIRFEAYKEGVSISTRMVSKDKDNEKLNINFNKYIILGVCDQVYVNQLKDNTNLFLPFYIILYEKDDKTYISVIKLKTQPGIFTKDELEYNVELKLKKIIERV